MIAIDLVVGAHHAAGMALLDADFKGEQIAFTRGRLGNPDIDKFAPGFLTVERVMLDRGNDMVGLDPRNRRAHQHPGQQRIFRQVFERPPVARIARQIGTTGQQHVETLGACLAADHCPAAAHQVGVPRGRLGQTRRQRGGTVVSHPADPGDSQAGIGFPERGNAKAGDAGHIASAGDGIGRNRDARKYRQRHDAVGQHDLFVGVHPGDRCPRPAFCRLGSIRRRVGQRDARRRCQSERDQSGKLLTDRHGSASATRGCSAKAPRAYLAKPRLPCLANLVSKKSG